MATQEQLEEIKNMIAKLEAFREASPSRFMSKPSKQVGESHAEFGLRLDKWEIDWADYKEKLRVHRQQEWQIEREIEDLIKQYTSLKDHRNGENIWDYVKNNFDGHGYMELLESAEELLDIFGIS